MDVTQIDISGGSMPSRYELLSMVRKHSDFLNEGMLDQHDHKDVEMDQHYWKHMLHLYFVAGWDSVVARNHDDDDLVFFVRNAGSPRSEVDEEGDVRDVAPYFVRRWAPKLENIVGENYAEVDWRRSFYLNFIAHTGFTVTVAICSVQALHKHQNNQDEPLSPIYKVVKTVYASPNRVNFQLGSNKGLESVPAYPTICFAIDDFDDTFDAVVLSETDHCYCVILNAHNGAAFPTVANTSHDSESMPPDLDPKRPSKLTLFSGFVSYPMVRDAYDAGKSRFGSLLSIGNVHTKTDRLYMKGPGGIGEVEVAVSGVADQSQNDSRPLSPLQLRNDGSGIGFGTIFRRAASAASEVAKQAYASASATRKADIELLPLKCCLMSISLPWEYIAHELLFKVAPPVNL